MADVGARIEHLERQNRRLWRCLYGLLGMGGVAMFAAAYQPEVTPDVIQARRFEVINEDGNVVWRADNSKAGGYTETLRSDGTTKCWWSGASPRDGGGMSIVWGGENNEFRCISSTWNDGAFTGCVHGEDGKPSHQDGFTAQLDRRRGVRVSVQHNGTEIWETGKNQGLSAVPESP